MLKKSQIRKKKQGLQPRAQTTRDAIIAASIRLLSNEGVEAFNTNRIAELSGISVGSLYQYFGNKESILEELVRDAIEKRVSFATKVLLSPSQDLNPREAIEILVEAAMQTPNLTPKADQILFDLDHLILKHEKIKSVDERLLPLMKDYLDFYFPKASKKNSELVLLIVLSSTRGVVYASQSGGFKRFTKKEVKEHLCQMIYGYLSETYR